jgi:hypothetical protein
MASGSAARLVGGSGIALQDGHLLSLLQYRTAGLQLELSVSKDIKLPIYI